MIPTVLLFTAAVLYRLVTAPFGAEHTWLLNFSPVAAVALCGPVIFPRRVALVLPLAVLLASDLVLNRYWGATLVTVEMGARYVALGLIALLGLRLRESRNLGVFMTASVGSSATFYFLTNTVSWLTAPEYAKTVAGWVQALTVGIPGYPPTWLFFRNSIVSDAAFTLAMLGCLALAARNESPRGGVLVPLAKALHG